MKLSSRLASIASLRKRPTADGHDLSLFGLGRRRMRGTKLDVAFPSDRHWPIPHGVRLDICIFNRWILGLFVVILIQFQCIGEIRQYVVSLGKVANHESLPSFSFHDDRCIPCCLFTLMTKALHLWGFWRPLQRLIEMSRCMAILLQEHSYHEIHHLYCEPLSDDQSLA